MRPREQARHSSQKSIMRFGEQRAYTRPPSLLLTVLDVYRAPTPFLAFPSGAASLSS
jgi:hypothetical protein